MINKRFIYILQIASITYIWIFSLGVAIWILNLIFVAHRLNDAFDASLAISIVAIPVFLVLAGVLTYVFVGIQKGKDHRQTADPISEQKPTPAAAKPPAF